MNKSVVVALIFALIFFSNIFLVCNVEACKDIVACGDATDGDFNLLLKVRDPSRPGLQVLCIVPEGYEYTYHYPWTGKLFKSTVTQKFIGVASQDDVIPNIVKAGMVLSEAGISYGDADTDSNWVNPSKNAWDDFDWIRYACEKADTEDQAVELLTVDAVKKKHATGVSENLFVVGPEKGFVIEADAFHYEIKEIKNGVVVMHNYPKELWRSQIRKKLPISFSFDIVKEKYIRKGRTLRLSSRYGIRIKDINEDSIVVQHVPYFKIVNRKIKNLGEPVTIKLGARETVQDFSIELLNIDGNKAKIKLLNKFKAWEDRMMGYIQSRYGSIDVSDMIEWSRLHSEDLDGLRPMCQDSKTFEAVAIYKIPKFNYEILSMGWFSPNHACSSIYVPFHICNTDIFEPYETGEAAELSLNLLNEYGHSVLSDVFSKTEEVFLREIDIAQEITENKNCCPEIVSNFLTAIDMGMQRQAYLTEKIWMDISKISDDITKEFVIDIVDGIWIDDYFSSLKMMEESIEKLEDLPNTDSIVTKIGDIALNLCKSRIDAANIIGTKTQSAEKRYETGHSLIKEGNFEKGFNQIKIAFVECDNLIKGQKHTDILDEENANNGKIDSLIYFSYIILVFSVLLIIFRKKII